MTPSPATAELVRAAKSLLIRFEESPYGTDDRPGRVDVVRGCWYERDLRAALLAVEREEKETPKVEDWLYVFECRTCKAHFSMPCGCGVGKHQGHDYAPGVYVRSAERPIPAEPPKKPTLEERVASLEARLKEGGL